MQNDKGENVYENNNTTCTCMSQTIIIKLLWISMCRRILGSIRS